MSTVNFPRFWFKKNHALLYKMPRKYYLTNCIKLKLNLRINSLKIIGWRTKLKFPALYSGMYETDSVLKIIHKIKEICFIFWIV